MSVSLTKVAEIAGALPGVVVGARWNHRTWLVNEHGFAWDRGLSKADIARYGSSPLPRGDIVAVIVDGLDAKDALLAMELPGFFTIPHFNGYAAVLIELRLARLADVRRAIEDAHRVAASRPPKKPKPAKRRAGKKSG